MKKHTLKTWTILALSFFGLANVSAQVVALGKYTETEGFTATHYIKNANPNEPFNFAIKVEDESIKMLLSAEKDRTLALAAFRYADSAGVVTNFSNHEIRLTPKGNYIYVAEDYLVLSNLQFDNSEYKHF